jgi:hypothetical protein
MVWGNSKEEGEKAAKEARMDSSHGSLGRNLPCVVDPRYKCFDRYLPGS